MSGKVRVVELTPELDADKVQRLAQLDASIARGIADADAGRVYAAAGVFAELRARLTRKADAPRR
jgi:antitoxin ParD1/3/4